MAGSGPMSSPSSPSKSSRVGRESSRTGRHLPTTLLAGAAAMLVAAMETTAPRLLRLYRFRVVGGESTDGCGDDGCGAGAEVARDDGDAAHTTGSSSEDRNLMSAIVKTHSTFTATSRERRRNLREKRSRNSCFYPAGTHAFKTRTKRSWPYVTNETPRHLAPTHTDGTTSVGRVASATAAVAPTSTAGPFSFRRPREPPSTVADERKLRQARSEREAI